MYSDIYIKEEKTDNTAVERPELVCYIGLYVDLYNYLVVLVIYAQLQACVPRGKCEVTITISN